MEAPYYVCMNNADIPKTYFVSSVYILLQQSAF